MRQNKFLLLLLIFALFLSFCLISCSSGGDTAASAQNLRVFVTSTTGTGDLSSWDEITGLETGLAAGDAICQARADAAGLSGTYRAWLSDSTTDAYCHIHGLTGTKTSACGGALSTAYGPWVRMDGFPFGETIDTITSTGQIYAPVRFDETGAPITVYPDTMYFTNTDPDGAWRSGFNSCTNWTVANADSVRVGYVNETTGGWTSGGSVQCNNSDIRLLCMQTGEGPDLPSHTSTGKIVFVTSTDGNGDLSTWTGASGSGLAAGDAICQARATDAGLSGTYTAWLSDDTIDALDRITEGARVRLDGVRIADSKADLTDGELFSSISLTENGYYLSNYGVWTGTEYTGLKAADNCSNWTSTGTNAHEGRTNQTTDRWTAYTTSACSNTVYHLYCFED